MSSNTHFEIVTHKLFADRSFILCVISNIRRVLIVQYLDKWI